jgi:dihydrofolate reductase
MTRTPPSPHPSPFDTVRVTLIAAAAENNVIGADGRIPWHLSADLQRFKRLTMGHPIIMGRKTWESIGRPLPGRVNVVITRREDYKAPGAVIVNGLEDALRHVQRAGHPEAFVIGGGDIYRLALPHADRVELTRVHTRVDGDARFPELDETEWREVVREAHEGEGLAYTFLTLERR